MCQAQFPSNKELLAHAVAAHQRRICTICLQVDARQSSSCGHASKPCDAACGS